MRTRGQPDRLAGPVRWGTRREQQSSRGRPQPFGSLLLLCFLWRLLSIDKAAFRGGLVNRGEGTPIEFWVGGMRFWGSRERLAVVCEERVSTLRGRADERLEKCQSNELVLREPSVSECRGSGR
jgi:hypothetical protein